VAALIAAQRDEHGIPHAVSCRALGLSQAWFYKWARGDVSPARARRAVLAAEVTRLFRAHNGTYGSPRITADLRDLGWAVSENTVAALMRERGLAARRKKRRRSLTRPGKGRWRAPDLVGRDFTAEDVNQKWFGDGTEITTGEGKLYLASVLVQAERRVSSRGAITIARQRIHIGIVHAGRTLTVESADHTFRIYDGDQLLAETGRTTTKPIARFKVRKPEPPRQRHPAQGSAIWH
jgi:hypothetical protein